MKPTECRSCCNETFVDGRCTHPDCRHRELSPTEIDAYQQRAIKKATRFVDELQEELFSEVGVRNAYLIAAYALQNAYLGALRKSKMEGLRRRRRSSAH